LLRGSRTPALGLTAQKGEAVNSTLGVRCDFVTDSNICRLPDPIRVTHIEPAERSSTAVHPWRLVAAQQLLAVEMSRPGDRECFLIRHVRTDLRTVERERPMVSVLYKGRWFVGSKERFLRTDDIVSRP
jgi:hypothetical protein